MKGRKKKKPSIVVLGGTNWVESKSNTWPHLIRPSIRNFSMLHRFRGGYSCVYEFCKHSNIPWRTTGDTCHVSWSEISVYLQECTRIHELRGRGGNVWSLPAMERSKQLRSWTCTVSKRKKERKKFSLWMWVNIRMETKSCSCSDD